MFALLSQATAVLCALLCVAFLVAPGRYMALYGVHAEPGAVFLGRRAAPLFLGLCVLFWALSGQPTGPLRNAATLAIVVTFVGIALTGVAAFLGGTASRAILVAAGLETTIALLFVIAR